MEAEDKILFDRIIRLLNSDEFAAAEEMSKLDPKRKEKFNLYITNKALHDESAKYRGRAIEMSIYLENVLARFLSCYFASENKINLLNSMVFDRMDLQRKLNLLKSILKTQHQKLWKQEKSKLKNIDKLVTFRNNLAHSVLNSTLEGKRKVLTKVKELERKGSKMKHLDEIEYGYFDNHKWVYKTTSADELNKYMLETLNSIDLIEKMGLEIINNYSRLTRSKIS